MSDQQRIEDYKWAVKGVRLAMKFCGVYFKDNLPVWQKLLIMFRASLQVIMVVNFITIPSIMALTKVWGDLTLVIDNLIVCIPDTLCICHFCTMWYKREEINVLFHEMKKDWMVPKTTAERTIMMQNTKLSMKIGRFAHFIVAWLLTMYNVPYWTFGIMPRTHTNITDGVKPLLAQTIYFYDTTSNINFKLTALCQTISSMIVGISYSTAGCLFYTFILHVGAQLEILKIRLENMFDTSNDKLDDVRTNTPKYIGSTVRLHQKTIRFVEIIENIFSLLFLQQFLAMMVTISAEGFLIISMLVGDVEVPILAVCFTIFYVFYCMVMTLMYCLGGEYLIANSTAIYSATYNSQWYNSEKMYRMEITMIINRAQRPLFITAGKFVRMSLDTYTNFIKTTASYMSVLLAMKS